MGRAMLLHEPRSHLCPHLGCNRAGMFAAQPESFEETLSR